MRERSNLFIAVIGAALTFSASAATRTVENAHWLVEVDEMGGVLRALESKDAGIGLTPRGSYLFTESSWDRWHSREKLIKAPFEVRAGEKGEKVRGQRSKVKGQTEDDNHHCLTSNLRPLTSSSITHHSSLVTNSSLTTNSSGERNERLSVTALGQTAAGGIPFLQVGKRFLSEPDSTALTVDYRFINTPEAMSVQAYSPSIHLGLAMTNRIETFWYPTAKGVASRRQTSGSSITCNDFARGWLAVVDEKEGVGAALTFPFSEVFGLWVWLPGVPGVELKFQPVGIENGASYPLRLEVIPFRGLTCVTGAGGGFVGSLKGGTCRVVSAKACEAEAVWNGGKKKLVFRKPGDRIEFAASGEVEVRVKGEKGERAVCRIAPAEAKELAAEGTRRSAFKCEADLSSFTNFPKFNLRPWAKPLAGGPVKVSAISGQCNLMEIGALAECFDMDYRALGVIVAAGEKRSLNDPSYAFGDYFGQIGPKDIEREVNAMISREADVILLGGIPLDALPESSLKLLRETVAKGRGLVIVGNDDKMKGETFGGSSRVVRLDYQAAPRIAAYLISGITPDLRDFYPDRAPEFERYYSQVAKAIMRAAGRVVSDKVISDKVVSDKVNALTTNHSSLITNSSDKVVSDKVKGVNIPSLITHHSSLTTNHSSLTTNSSDKGVVCEWVAYNSFREKLAEGRGAMPKPQELPTFSGPISVEYSLRRNGKVVDWGERIVTNAPPAEIVSLTPEKGFVLEGDMVHLVAKVRGKAQGMKLRFRFYDVYDRLLDERTLDAAAEVCADFRAEDALLTRSFHYTAELVEGGRTVSRRRGRLAARPKAEKLAWDDYQIATCGDSLTRYYLYPQLAAAYRGAYITYASGQWPVRDTLAPFYNFATGEGTHIGLQREGAHAAEYAKTGDKMTLVRHHCLSDPKQLEGLTNFFHRVYAKTLYARGHQQHGFGDEMSLTDHEGRPIDFCFSPHCLREFRAFAKARYGTLAKLNEAYESDFRSWDEVLPFTRDEVWKAGGKHVAGWSDHLEFMDDRVTNRLMAAISVLRSFDPNLIFTLSGTQPPAAYSGMDWSKVMQCLTGTEGYELGGQYDLHRSFCPNGRFTPWSMGYAKRGKAAAHALWESVFHGCQGATAFWSRSQFRPDLTPARCVTDILPDLERLAHGTGKYFVNCLETDHDVALYYSQPSFRGAFIENRRKEQDALLERSRVLLRRLGVGFDYVSYDQAKRGELAKRGYRAVFLVDAVAMGDDEVAAVKGFANRGGTVVAVKMPALRGADCRLRKRSPFEGFFDGKRRRLIQPAAEIDGDCAAYREALAAARVKTDTLKIACEGAAPRIFAAHDSRGNRFWGVLSDDFLVRKAAVTFPRKGCVYDLVSGKSWAATDAITVKLGKGTAHAFVLLAEPTGVKSLVEREGRIWLDTGSADDTVVRVTVARPDGSDAPYYARNIVVRGGKADFAVPFCLSDPSGRWTVKARNVLSGEMKICPIMKGNGK